MTQSAAQHGAVARTLSGLRRANRAVGLLLGLVLAATVVFVILDVVLRQTGGSLGGSDEISGYVMAALASWGLAVALTERAHVRIDLLRQMSGEKMRAVFDLISIACLTGVAVLVAYQAWPVLSKTLERGSRANTPLETPLWIPQGIWFAGWLWFAICAVATLILALILAARTDWDALESAVGMDHEGEEALAEARRQKGERA
ncbi:TRAP transporter small permease subunit [Paracoccus sediminicola]|uniref:TRAP transporter small permease subunit n=1 Tax=Paracoccus sediminicola TaxID=3017783 RepID=UPI0022F00264|nr:TRAP transporter small permease [Paracoccus sediminicola]WBU57489.1 TRAP transporter small permease [Paracoccus sediminicola]